MTDSDIGMTHLGSWIQSNCTAMDAGILVLIFINYIVITKRATRIAEVTARSTLDVMPGKQMSIDANLNAGLIPGMPKTAFMIIASVTLFVAYMVFKKSEEVEESQKR